jgi:putative ABC transport system permease protein
VNEAFAQQYFGGADPVGGHVTIRPIALGSPDPVVREIVGVIAPVKMRPDAPPNALEIYVPYTQNPWFGTRLTVQTASAPTAIVLAVRTAISHIDRAVTITRVRTMDDVAAESTARPRFRAQLVTVFASGAIALAAAGVFSVLLFNVQQRRREFGIRIALGARADDIVRVVLGEGAGLAGMGLTVGLAGTVLVSRWLQSLLFGVQPIDAATYVASACLLGTVAVLASVGPAVRAARSDPAAALRDP